MKRNLQDLSGSVLVCALLALAASPALAQTAKQSYQGRDAVANEVLVKFQQAPPNDALAAANISADIQQEEAAADIDTSRSVGSAGWVLLHSRSYDVTTLMSKLTGAASVAHVEPNWIMRSDQAVNDPYFPCQWGLQNTGQSCTGFALGVAGADINAVGAWGISHGSPNIVVGVIGSGIDYNHPDLAANVWTAPGSYTFYQGTSLILCGAGTHGWNAVNQTCDPMDDSADGHETFVAGVIGAVADNGVDVAGVNWSTRMLPCVSAAGGGETTAHLVDCIQFMEGAKASNGGRGGTADIRVLNDSYAGSGYSDAVYNELNNAMKADMLFVASAGNDGNNNDTNPVYPASYDLANVVAVAATDNYDYLANYNYDFFNSNYGASTVDLGAPGAGIYSTLPTNLGSVGYGSGTSASAPFVAGTAALSLSVCNGDWVWLSSNILGNVVQIPSLSGKTVTGGRVNAYNSLDAASLACPGTGYGTVHGTEQSTLRKHPICQPPSPDCLIYDSGTVSLTVNGATAQADYGQGSTSTSIAEDLRVAIDQNGNYPVYAHASGSQVILAAKTTGSNTCYTVSTSTTWDSFDFSGPSFTVSLSGPALTGCK
jgi:subtilisin family serine protease